MAQKFQDLLVHQLLPDYLSLEMLKVVILQLLEYLLMQELVTDQEQGLAHKVLDKPQDILEQTIPQIMILNHLKCNK